MPLPGQNGGILRGLSGLGNLPLGPGAPAPNQYRTPPGCQNPLSSPAGYRATPIDPTEALLQGLDSGSKRLMDLSLDDLETFIRNAIFWNQPSPLQAPPYRGYYKEITALQVIGPPTSTATAAATAGALALAAGANVTQDPADPVVVNTPATPGAWVDVATFQTPSNQAYLIYSIEAWGHDWLGSLNAVKWRVLNAGTPVLDGRPLGIMGEQVKIQSILRPGNELKIQATTWDPSSGTLVNMRMQGWIFPLPCTDDDMWALVKDAQEGRQVLAVSAGGGAGGGGSYQAPPQPAPVGELRGVPMQYEPASGRFLPPRPDGGLWLVNASGMVVN